MLFRTEKFKNPHISHKDRDSAVKKQRKSGIYQKSVKKEGCEWPLSEAKVPERPLFSRVLSHKTMFFFYFPFSAESLEPKIRHIVKKRKSIV